jgi:hypothetical protein
MTRRSDVAARQDPLRARYADDPTDAFITDAARTRDGLGLDPWHGRVVPGDHDYDVRGTLMVDRTVPVGFQRMRCAVTLETEPGTPPGAREKLFAAAEHCCVNLQTLRTGVPIETTLLSLSDNSRSSPPPGPSSPAGSAR